MKKAARPNKIVNVAGILPADWLLAVDRTSPILSLGLDVGTTVKKTSNPSVLSLGQKVGFEHRFPLIVRYKSKDPAVTIAIIEAILDGLATLGLRVRRLCIDATSEKYFAIAVRKHFAGRLVVDLIVSSEATEYAGERMLWKAYLGNLFVNTAEDGYLALPPEQWVKADIRSVTTEKGTFDAEVLEDGSHGDVFDGCKLALHGQVAKGGPSEIAAVGVGVTTHRPRAGIKNPFARENRGGGRGFSRAR